MSAAIVDGHNLDIDVIPAAVWLFVLNARIGEMNMPIEVRQVVLACPIFDLRLVAIRPAVAVRAATIPLLEVLLVLALELVVEDDSFDASTSLLEALGLTLARPT